MTMIESPIQMEDCNNICIQLQTRDFNEDSKTLRSLPSFNSDSEPPSYFEALRIPQQQQHPHDLSLTQQQQESDTKESSFVPSSISQLRHHYIRTQHLPASVYSNNQANISNIQKPSETYFVWSVFTTFYCVFIGVAALVLSYQIYTLNKEQNYQKAFTKSKLCRNVNIAGLFVGIVYLIIAILICLLPRY